jgi:hypothetical protein
VPYGNSFGLHRTAVHTDRQIIYTEYIILNLYIDVVQQQVYQVGKVVGCCKGTTVCEVDSGVLTGMIGCILYPVCYMEK